MKRAAGIPCGPFGIAGLCNQGLRAVATAMPAGARQGRDRGATGVRQGRYRGADGAATGNHPGRCGGVPRRYGYDVFAVACDRKGAETMLHPCP